MDSKTRVIDIAPFGTVDGTRAPTLVVCPLLLLTTTDLSHRLGRHETKNNKVRFTSANIWI